MEDTAADEVTDSTAEVLRCCTFCNCPILGDTVLTHLSFDDETVRVRTHPECRENLGTTDAVNRAVVFTYYDTLLLTLNLLDH